MRLSVKIAAPVSTMTSNAVLRDDAAGVGDAVVAHSPTRPGMVHDSKGESHTRSQQTLVTQKPLPQSVVAAHAAPSGARVCVAVGVCVGVGVNVGVGVAVSVGVGLQIDE